MILTVIPVLVHLKMHDIDVYSVYYC